MALVMCNDSYSVTAHQIRHICTMPLTSSLALRQEARVRAASCCVINRPASLTGFKEVFSCWVSGYTEVCHGLKSYVWTVSPFTVFLKSFHSCVVEIFGFHLTGEKTGMFYYNSSASVIDFHWLSSETWSFPELYSRKKGERVVWGYEKERNGKQNSKQNKEIQDFICFGIWSTLSRPVVVPI